MSEDWVRKYISQKYKNEVRAKAAFARWCHAKNNPIKKTSFSENKPKSSSLKDPNPLIEEQLIADNLLRRHLNDAQKVRAALRLEDIERKKARRRQAIQAIINNPKIPSEKKVENFPPSLKEEKGKVRDIVAQKVGFGSGKQYEKAKKVYLEVAEEVKFSAR